MEGGPGSPKRQRLDAPEDDIAADEDEDILETSGGNEATSEEAFSRDYNGNQGLKDDLSANSSSDKDIKREKYEH